MHMVRLGESEVTVLDSYQSGGLLLIIMNMADWLPSANSGYFVRAPGFAVLKCAVTRCGTSRAVLVLEHELPGGAARESLLLSAMTGENAADSLGGEHYQLNKLAVIRRDEALPHGFGFNFYQVDRAKGRLLADLECANVAAGAALFATLSGLVQPDRSGIVYATNLGTEQQIALWPATRSHSWLGHWHVRFLRDASRAALQSSLEEPLSLVNADGRSVDYWIIERGNVFVLANIDPRHAEPELPELVDQLAACGGKQAESLGADAQRANQPKVLLYAVERREAAEAWVRATCFFQGEQHASLPGSGAMCLASFLAATHLDAIAPSASRGEIVFHLAHPSGALDVHVYWERGDAGYRITATEFVTPVRLLLYGTTIVPFAAEALQ